MVSASSLVRPAWALSWRCKSSPEQVTAKEGKRRGGRVTAGGLPVGFCLGGLLEFIVRVYGDLDPPV